MHSDNNIVRDTVLHIAKLAAEKKGENITFMDMRKVSTVCDWFVLISASSTRRINAISKAVDKGLSAEKISPLHIAGRKNPYWVLMDYGDIVVHIFYKAIREFYGLERLWSDAPREEFDVKCLEKTARKNCQKPS